MTVPRPPAKIPSYMQPANDSRSLIFLILLLITTRAVVIALTMDSIASQDMEYWNIVAASLRAGENPYVTTHFLNWPPLWMLCIWGLDTIAQSAQLSLKVVIKSALIVPEIGILLGSRVLLKELGRNPVWFPTLLFGLVLNPVPILLTCIHGNFDALVALWCLVAVVFAIRFLKTEKTSDRLGSAFGIGLGILTKTVPFALLPLIFIKGRFRPKSETLFAIALALVPGLLGVCLIYLAAPEALNEKVIGYRGSTGWFGVSGVGEAAGYGRLVRKIYPSIFLIGLLTAMFGILKEFAGEKRIESRSVLSASIFLLLLVPTFGPGFGLQYAYWTLPLIVVGIPVLGTRFALSACLHLFATALLYLWLYSITPSLGAFLPPLGNYFGVEVGTRIYSKFESTLITAPIFFTATWIIYESMRITLSRRTG